MKPEGAIFDLDGTLTDSMYIWEEVPKTLVRQFGKVPSDDLSEALKELGCPEGAEYLIDTFHLDRTVEEVMDAINDLVTIEYREKVPMKAGADRLLARLSELHIPCAIATAIETFQAQEAMERLGLWKYFQFAVSSNQYGPKTKPDIYLEAARRMGTVPSRTLVFEDALHAVRTAKAAGFLTVGVYDPSAQEDQDALRQLCDWYLPRLDDDSFLQRFVQTAD